MDKLVMTPKEKLLSLISEEKEQFGEYSQLCAIYQVKPDPIVVARHQAKLEVLETLLQEKIITKI